MIVGWQALVFYSGITQQLEPDYKYYMDTYLKANPCPPLNLMLRESSFTLTISNTYLQEVQAGFTNATCCPFARLDIYERMTAVEGPAGIFWGVKVRHFRHHPTPLSLSSSLSASLPLTPSPLNITPSSPSSPFPITDG